MSSNEHTHCSVHLKKDRLIYIIEEIEKKTSARGWSDSEFMIMTMIQHMSRQLHYGGMNRFECIMYKGKKERMEHLPIKWKASSKYCFKFCW